MNSKSPSKKAEKDVAIQNAKKDATKQEKVGGTNKAATKKEKIPKAKKDVAEKEKNPKPKKKAAKKTETGMVKELKISLQKLTEEEINNNTKEDKVVESASTESNEIDMIKQE